MNKNKLKLILIVGESGVGKDTIVNTLCKYYGYIRVVSYTDRPMRDCEMIGREHVVVSTDDFNDLEFGTRILAPVTIQGYHYGLPEICLENLSKTALYIIEPSGVYWFKEHQDEFNIDLKIVRITLDLEERLRRISNRSDCEIVKERIHKEKVLFEDFDADFCDVITIVNKDSSESADYLSKILNINE